MTPFRAIGDLKLVNTAGQILALLLLLASALHACCSSHQAHAASLLSVPVHNQGHLTGPVHAAPCSSSVCHPSAQEGSFWAMLCSQMRPFILVPLVCRPMDSALTAARHQTSPGHLSATVCNSLQRTHPRDISAPTKEEPS